MTDNINISSGTGTPIAADNINGVFYQRVKLSIGADGEAADLDSGQNTKANSLPVTLASDQGALPITDNSGSLTVDNLVLSIVGGGTEATAQRVTIASDSTGVLSIDDNSGSLTVDQSAHDNLCANANMQIANADASAANPVPIQTKDNVLELTLSVDTSAYHSGDVLADTQELANFFPVSGKAVTINSVTVLDEDDNAGVIELVFMKSNVSLGAENAGVAVSDTDAREILGYVKIAASDYIDLGGCQVATVYPGRLVVKSAGTSLWIGAVSRDTKTYTASGLKLKIGIE